MSDTKSDYSDASRHYLKDIVPKSTVEQERVRKAKEREARYNDDWLKHPANINDVDRFAPGAKGRKKGYKRKYVGKNYIVFADMIAGYLRIIDKKTGMFIIILEGKPRKEERETHFKILKR